MLKMIKQERGNPSRWIKKEEHKIDVRVPGLSHSVVKEAQHLRIQELVKRIETHPHRCETIPKVQCSHCLLYWNQGILYCTCGQCLIYSESRRKFHRQRLDAISIPDCVIKDGATHGARHGNTEVQRKYHMAWNAWKRCCKKVDSQGEHFTGIHDRFLRDPAYRESQLAIGWSEQRCKEWDELAKEDHTCKLTPEERRRYKGQRHLTLNKAGKTGPMKLRSDYRAAVLMKIVYFMNQENKLKCVSIQVNNLSSARVDQRPGWQYWPSSSSSSWWYASEWSWK